MEQHYEAIAKILGGSLHSSNRLKGIVKTFIEYFSSVDRNFNIEKFSKDALNGQYIEEYIEEPVIEPKVNTWAPKPITTVSSTADRIHDDWKDAMGRMSKIIGKSNGSNKVKRGKHGKKQKT